MCDRLSCDPWTRACTRPLTATSTTRCRHQRRPGSAWSWGSSAAEGGVLGFRWAPGWCGCGRLPSSDPHRTSSISQLQTQGPGRTQAPSYLYAVPVSNVSQSGLTSAPTALAHHIPLTIACLRASCGAPRTGSRHHPRALDISGGPELPVCTVPLTCARLGGGRPSCKHTVRTSMHTVHTRSCMQQQRTHSLRLGWLPAMRFRLSCLRVL